MLRGVETNGYGSGITLSKIEIEIAHCRVERSRIGVGNGVVRWHGPRRRRLIGTDWRVKLCMSAVEASTGKQKHVAKVILIAGSVVGQHEDRPMSAVADDAHPWPDVNSARDSIAAFGNEDDALNIFCFGRIDSSLKNRAIIAGAVCMNGEARTAEVDGFRIVEASRIHRLRFQLQNQTTQYDNPGEYTPFK